VKLAGRAGIAGPTGCVRPTGAGGDIARKGGLAGGLDDLVREPELAPGGDEDARLDARHGRHFLRV
jgi:hypothetical protein